MQRRVPITARLAHQNGVQRSQLLKRHSPITARANVRQRLAIAFCLQGDRAATRVGQAIEQSLFISALGKAQQR